jgi:hypothetical protein
MRGGDERSGSLFSYVDLEGRVSKAHPLRAIRGIVNEALAALSGEFSALYSRSGWSSTSCFAGSLASALTMPRGITRRSRRTASACWRATSPPSSRARCWRNRA